MKVVEFFSGIGSQSKALNRIAKKNNINIEILKTCEWNIHAFVAYNLIHNKGNYSMHNETMNKQEMLDELLKHKLSSDGKGLINPKHLKSFDEHALRIIYNAINQTKNLINITDVKGSDIPNDVDLFTYSFPCQDLSNVGSFHGYKNGIDRDANTRSGLLWEIERILEEKLALRQRLPEFLLLENVTALEAKRHEGNFNEWKEKLGKLGYINKIYRLNALDFGIPQNRRRLIMLSVYVGDNIDLLEKIEEYWILHDLNNSNYVKSLGIKKKKLSQFLRLDYNEETVLSEALEAQPNATPSRLKIWNENYKIVDEKDKIADKVQTITTKQDRHPNSGNIYIDVKNDKSLYRFLTPRECFILMGFDESDYEVLLKNNFLTRGKTKFFSRDILYKLAGNSIVVDVLEHVFNQMFYIKGSIIEKNKGINQNNEVEAKIQSWL